MFCLQALLPLLLFPQAASSPFFLAAYLTAIILNHRPCVYCLVLFLGALYASCFWGDPDSPTCSCWANVWPAYPDGSSLSWETHEAPATASVEDLPSNPVESLLSTVTWVARPFTSNKDNYELWVRTWFTPMHDDVLIPWPAASHGSSSAGASTGGSSGSSPDGG